MLYSDAEVEVISNEFNGAAVGGTTFDPAAAAAADEQPPNASKAQVQCDGGLSHSSAQATGSQGRRMIPEPEGAHRMQYSHKTIEGTPAGGSRLARRLGT